jgi:hypothetical protein
LSQGNSEDSAIVLIPVLISVVSFLIILVFLWNRWIGKDGNELKRRRALAYLPVHSAILNKRHTSEILRQLELHSDTLNLTDFDGNAVIDLCLKDITIPDEVLLAILRLSLPFDTKMRKEVFSRHVFQRSDVEYSPHR